MAPWNGPKNALLEQSLVFSNIRHDLRHQSIVLVRCNCRISHRVYRAGCLTNDRVTDDGLRLINLSRRRMPASHIQQADGCLASA